MTLNFSLGCSQSSWGCCSSLPGVSFLGHVDWRIPSSLPFLSNLIQIFQVFALRDKGKVAQWWWLEISSISQRFIVPVCCFLTWILSSSDITRWFFVEFVPLFWDKVLKSLGFFMCGSSGQQLDDLSWQDSPFLTELTNLPLKMDWIEQCCSQKCCFLYDWLLKGVNFVYIHLDGQRRWKVTVNWGERKTLHQLYLFSPPLWQEVAVTHGVIKPKDFAGFQFQNDWSLTFEMSFGALIYQCWLCGRLTFTGAVTWICLDLWNSAISATAPKDEM